jgi:TetR/AcrR family transcriptional regulator
MNDSFRRLPDEKKRRIRDAALEEFAQRGFDGASTNRIVAAAGISKGSLFKYFSSKDELYIYLADETMAEIIPIMKSRIAALPSDIAERIGLMSEAIIDIYVANPRYYRFFMGMLDAGARHIQMEIMKRHGEALGFMDLFSGVDDRRFRLPAESVFLLIKWLFAGIKQELFELTSVQNDPGLLKQGFMERLDTVLDLMEHGIYRSEA